MRLVVSMVKVKRRQLIAMQSGKDPITGYVLEEANATLDHDHKTGFIRAAIGRWNNGVMGKIENWANRLGADPVTGERITAVQYLRNIADYIELHEQSQHNGLLHPTHRTDREKKDLANKRARDKRRKDSKEARLEQTKNPDA